MKTELRVLFFSPVAWMLLIVFAFQVGIEYCDSLGDALRTQGLGYKPYNPTMQLVGGFRGVIGSMLNNLYLYIPLLTMGLMSRELGSGSIKLLYSSPVSNFQIIFGKYLSAIAYSLLLVVILLIPIFITMGGLKDADTPAMFTALFGLFITVAAYSAIGLFMSTITKYQVVAVVGTLALLGILNFIGEVGQNTDFLRDITYWLSIRGRSSVFLDGMWCTKDILYFLLIIFLFLSLCIIKLSGERRKLSVWNTVAKYTLLLAAVFLVGYLSSRPKFTYYYDATATKLNTLTEESQEVMKKIEGEITLTTYSNILDDTWYRCTPESRNYDITRFERYLRFRPDLKINYVYYWGKGNHKYYDEKYPEMTQEEKFARLCKDNDLNPKKFISESEIKDDLSLDYGRFVRVLKSSNGRVAYLRKYDDMYVDPFESEITAAFKTLVEKSPVIAFVTGHGEREAYDHGDRGYGPFATNIGFRNALINQGFTVREMTLGQQVPEDVDVVVLAEMKSALTPEEEVNFDLYLNAGRNLLILGEPRRQQFMNPVVAKLGLQFSEGVIVSPSKEYLDDVVAAQVMPTALDVSRYFNSLIARGYTVVTPSACAVNVIEEKGFKVTEVLASKPKGSWIEYETTDFMNEKSVLNPAKGEVERSNSILMALSRQVGEKEQRIFVAGDADCLSTTELTKNRAGLNGNNFGLITELFRHFSYNEYPIEMDRVRPPDDEFYLNDADLKWIKFGLIWSLPFLLIFISLFSWYRRKSN